MKTLETTMAISNTSSYLYPTNSTCHRPANVTLLVISELYPPHCHSYVALTFGKVIPSLAVMVTVINLTVVAVFLKPNVRSYTSFILSLIALADVFNIVCPSVVYVYFYSLGNYSDPVPYRLCRWTYYMSYICKGVFSCVSLWLTVLLAYIRSRCISSPLTACNFHTKRNIAASVLAILVMTLVVYGPSVFIFDFIPATILSDSTNHVTDSCYVIGKCKLRKIHLWMEIVFTSFLPCVLLICLNIRMLWSLRQAAKDRDLLLLCDSVNSRNSTFNGHKTVKCNNIKTLESEHEYIETRTMVPQTVKSAVHHKYLVSNLLATMLVRWHGRGRRGRLQTHDSIGSRDSAYQRLNRESRRTSWYVVLVVTAISSYELPTAALLGHTLLTSQRHESPLPLVLHGCSHMTLLVWQYVTYSLIFLVYCAMSSAFRTELLKTVTCWRAGPSSSKARQRKRKDADNMFTSPCSVRRHLTRSKEVGEAEPILDVERDSCFNEDQPMNGQE